ncbi:MAG: hypothetical protein RR259_11410 [Odoribacter sp.]
MKAIQLTLPTTNAIQKMPSFIYTPARRGSAEVTVMCSPKTSTITLMAMRKFRQTLKESVRSDDILKYRLTISLY